MKVQHIHSNLTPALIPHTKFHQGLWLQPVERPAWYYFMPKKTTSNTIEHKGFLKSVDGIIRPLVRRLHARGIKTTPSCAGHHMHERNLAGVYADLKKDAGEIVSDGLQLKDIETGTIYIYKNPRYRLPWNRNEFVRAALVYQKKGVLGIKTGRRRKLKQEILKLKVPGASIREKDGIVFLFTHQRHGDNRKAWNELTEKITALLKQYAG